MSDQGYIYVAQERGSILEVKVGHTFSKPEKRVKAIRGQMPVTCDVVASIQVPHPVAAEAYIQKRLADEHTRDEWFRYTEKVREFLCSVFGQSPLPPSPWTAPVEHKRLTIRREGNPGGVLPKGEGWKTREGLLAKWVIYFYARRAAGGDEALLSTSDWSKFGFNNAKLAEVVEACLPGYFNERPAHRKNCYSRLYNMFHKRAKGVKHVVRGISAEHPSCSKPMKKFRDEGYLLFKRYTG